MMRNSSAPRNSDYPQGGDADQRIVPALVL
jgi:hypothetical protein